MLVREKFNNPPQGAWCFTLKYVRNFTQSLISLPPKVQSSPVINYIKAGKTSDFSHKNYKCLRFLTKNVVIIKREDGSFYALEADCKHQNANLLTKGLSKDFIVTCPRHSWRYDMKTGACLTQEWAALRKYPLKIEDGVIFLGSKPLREEND